MEKTLESPLDCKEIKLVKPKGINPEYSLEGLMLNMKRQYFGHLMRRANSLKKILMLEKIESRRRRKRQSMRSLDGIDPIDMSLKGGSAGQGSLVKLQSMRSQRVGHY